MLLRCDVHTHGLADTIRPDIQTKLQAPESYRLLDLCLLLFSCAPAGRTVCASRRAARAASAAAAACGDAQHASHSARAACVSPSHTCAQLRIAIHPGSMHIQPTVAVQAPCMFNQLPHFCLRREVDHWVRWHVGRHAEAEERGSLFGAMISGKGAPMVLWRTAAFLSQLDIEPQR